MSSSFSQKRLYNMRHTQSQNNFIGMNMFLSLLCYIVNTVTGRKWCCIYALKQKSSKLNWHISCIPSLQFHLEFRNMFKNTRFQIGYGTTVIFFNINWCNNFMERILRIHFFRFILHRQKKTRRQNETEKMTTKREKQAHMLSKTNLTPSSIFLANYFQHSAYHVSYRSVDRECLV